jgi:hypothetical protein
VTYPFRSYDGRVTFDRQRTGDRVFDYANEGVAHYGLYADWVEEVRKLGGPEIMRDMWRSSEAYLQMWERTSGVPGPSCHTAPAAITPTGLGAIRLRSTADALLTSAGQPQERGRAWSWCVAGTGNAMRDAVAVLSPDGRVGLVGSNARGVTAGGVAAGAAARKLPRGTRRVAGGLLLRRARGASYVYVVRRGRVKFVAVAASSVARSAARLREYAALLRRARARQPAPAQAAPAAAHIRKPVPYVVTARHAGAGLGYLCLL